MSKKQNTNPRIEHVERTSADLLAENVAELKRLFPEAVTEGKVDFAKLREALGDAVDDRPERYSFTWAGKRDAIRLLQTPSRATLVPAPKESVNFDSTNNVFIEGENLEVLKLLYKSYAGRVKMIYIDPPYNTGNDFIYPDNFADPLDTYLKLTGQKDSEGNLLTSNPESSGRYHSAWLTMMYPRLFVARQLLAEDGIIFISIDDSEVANLKLLMNEVFGEENFLACIVWQKKYAVSSDAKGIPPMHDYVLAYTRSSLFNPNLLPRTEKQDAHYSNPDNDPRGPWRPDNLTRSEYRQRDCYQITSPKTGKVFYPPKGASWRHPQDVVLKMIADNRIWFGKDGSSRPVPKRFLSEVRQGIVVSGWWPHTDAGHNDEAKKELQALFDGDSPFDTPKPTRLVRRMLTVCTEPCAGDLVVDFFAGSCTTADAIMQQNREDGGNRRLIMVQMPEATPESSQARQAGFDSIAEIGKERVRRVIKKLKDESKGKLAFNDREGPEDLGFKVFKLAESNYRPWKGVQEKDGEAFARTMGMFIDPLLPGWKTQDVIYEVALKEGYSLTSQIAEVYPQITQISQKGKAAKEQSVKSAQSADENAVYRVTDADKGQSFLICLDDKLKAAAIKALGLKKDDLFICRDVALTDEQAANLALQCKLKTI
jgi:adenine-specific DNA-methyltransferase